MKEKRNMEKGMKEIQKITSFTVDHTVLQEGMYISRVDGDITTFDLRTRKPNAGDYMDHATMHTLEHLFATYIRNGELRNNIIYYGPMGCQTGFYLLIRGSDNETVLREVKKTCERILAHEGPVFGAASRECGNYRNLNLEKAKIEARRYLDELNSREQTFTYDE